MTPRGLFYCSFNDECNLAPEVWRKHGNKTNIGFCRKHAIELGLKTDTIVTRTPVKKKSLLNELLEEIAAGKIVELLPPVREIRNQFSVDGKLSDLPF